MKDVLVVGALNIDMIYTISKVSIIPAMATATRGGEYVVSEAAMMQLKGQVEKVAKLRARNLGGQAGNFAVALGRMGTKVSVLGHVGADEDGRFLLRCLGGVDTSCVIQSGISGKALILVEPEVSAPFSSRPTPIMTSASASSTLFLPASTSLYI